MVLQSHHRLPRPCVRQVSGTQGLRKLAVDFLRFQSPWLTFLVDRGTEKVKQREFGSPLTKTGFDLEKTSNVKMFNSNRIQTSKL